MRPALPIGLRGRLLVRLSGLFPPADLTRHGADGAYTRWQRACVRRSWDAVARGCFDLQGKTVVDLGCGEGGKTVFYAGQGARLIVGVDCDEEHLGRASLLARSEGADNCRFIAARAEATGFPAESFDAAISDDAFEHYPDPAAVLCEAGRILKEGGLLLVQFTPYWGPTGPHLYDFIRLPYAHLFFGWTTMEQAARHLAIEMEKTGGHRMRETPTRHLEKALFQLRHYINRMSVRRFRRLLRAQPGWQLVRFHRYAVSRFGLPFVLLRNMPAIEELGGHLFAVLRKTTGSRISRRSFFAARTRLDAPRLLPFDGFEVA